MSEPLVECEECDRADSINDVTDMPPLYCPYCGGRRHVRIDPETPGDTKTSRV